MLRRKPERITKTLVAIITTLLIFTGVVISQANTARADNPDWFLYFMEEPVSEGEHTTNYERTISLKSPSPGTISDNYPDHNFRLKVWATGVDPWRGGYAGPLPYDCNVLYIELSDGETPFYYNETILSYDPLHPDGVDWVLYTFPFCHNHTASGVDINIHIWTTYKNQVGDAARLHTGLWIQCLGTLASGENPDSDSDSLSDDDELDYPQTSPLSKDTDQDKFNGLSATNLEDYHEINTHNTNPLTKDSDNDYMADEYEINCGDSDGGWQNPNLHNKRYAVLIVGDKVESDPLNEFWNDVVILYDILTMNGYIDDEDEGFDPQTDHIAVLYGDGEDYKGEITGTKIAQKFIASSNYYMKNVTLYPKGGTLVGNVRIETDSGGSPSGVLAGPDAKKENATLNNGTETLIELDNITGLLEGYSFWLVFEQTSGSGEFLGGTDGTSDQCKYYFNYDGSWKTSETVENIYFKIWDNSNPSIVKESYTTTDTDSENICGGFNPRYKPDHPITDLSATKTNIDSVFEDIGVQGQLSENDFLFVWTFDHGGSVSGNSTLQFWSDNTGTKIAQKFTAQGSYTLEAVSLYQKSGGDLVGDVRVVNDNDGIPDSGIIASATNQTLNAGSATKITLSTGSIENGYDYWIVFERTNGSGIFLGGTNGPSDRCKWWYRDSWNLSSNVENIYFKTWDDSVVQESYTTSDTDSETICGIQTIQDDIFAGSTNKYLAHTPLYARRVFFMQQCHSGGFIRELGIYHPNTITATACNASEGAWRADNSPGDENEEYAGKTYYHGEFNLHFMSAFYGETPVGDDVNADDNNDGYISVWEAYKWAEQHDSCSGESPQYDDDGNGDSQQDGDNDDGLFGSTTFI